MRDDRLGLLFDGKFASGSIHRDHRLGVATWKNIQPMIMHYDIIRNEFMKRTLVLQESKPSDRKCGRKATGVATLRLGKPTRHGNRLAASCPFHMKLRCTVDLASLSRADFQQRDVTLQCENSSTTVTLRLTTIIQSSVPAPHSTPSQVNRMRSQCGSDVSSVLTPHSSSCPDRESITDVGDPNNGHGDKRNLLDWIPRASVWWKATSEPFSDLRAASEKHKPNGRSYSF
mmetsp:Transcript_35299/g.62959  ORF Transcript_35299/g.62959 Transcript_35299/m.62959 type:complete len:230 (-) Transcript_35299:248-937(-)